MIDAINRKRILILVAMVFLTLTLVACGNREEEKKKTKIRAVAQKYFDALRVGDQEGVYDCYLPIERQKRDAEAELWGLASKMILNIDLGGVLSNWNILFGEESAFAKYKYKAADVDLSEDGTEAVAYVDVYEEKELRGSVRVDMTEYGGDWYVVKGTIADDDRNQEEAAGSEEDGSNGSAVCDDGEEGVSNGSVTHDDSGGNRVQGDGQAAVGNNTMMESSGRIWIPILAAVISMAAVVFFIQLYRLRSGRKKTVTEIPFTNPSVNKMEPGDILCSCGMVNPAGIRTCMGCGKKLKKRRG